MMVLAHGTGSEVASLASGLFIVLYLCGVHFAQRRIRKSWSTARTASFVTGCALLAIALSPAMDHTARIDATGHMAQHLLVGMFAPIGLALGAPLTLLLAALPVARRRRVRRFTGMWPVRLLTSAPIAAGLNIAGLYVLYLTPLYALSASSDAVHHLVHLHFIGAGYLFAWTIAGPDPIPNRGTIGQRAVILIAAGGAHAFLAKLLYSRAGSWPPESAHPTADMQSAAQWMYYGGHAADLALAILLMATWYRRAPRVRPSIPASIGGGKLGPTWA